MKFAIHMHAFLLAALLATAVAAPDPGIPKAPLAVTLSVSADMKSIQANVTNTGAEVSGSITFYNFLQLSSLPVTRCNHHTHPSFYGR
jgi:hypothetical protein